MKLRTDDDIYRARLTWLGPTGYTLPVHLPYTQWGLGALATFVLVGLARLLSGGWGFTGVGVAAAIAVTWWVFKHVDPDRPARKVIVTAATDWRATPTATPEKPVGLAAGRVRFAKEEQR
jgi:hypothetical protein